MNPGSDGSAFRLATRAGGIRPSAIREILKVAGMPDVISFAGGLPAPELFPVEAFRIAAEEALRDDGPASLQYDVSEGHRPLREWVCEHLRRTVGLSAAPDRVLITHGSQQALDLVAKVLIDPGDVVLTENPAYLGALQAFRAYEADVRGLPTDAQGVELGALRDFLRRAGRRPKFLYLVTNFQNPTGTGTSAARRRELASIAAEHGLPVLEDDPYGQLRYSGEPVPALAAAPGASHCLYLGTSSKILAPGMRVAWLAVPDAAFHQRLVAAKQAADLHTSSFTQRVVWRALSRPGFLEAHLARLRAAYARRRDAMLDSLARHFPEGCTWTRPDGGLFLWMTLPEGVDAAGLLPGCAEAKVAFVPGAPFWVGAPKRGTLRLNFSNASEERIEEGVRRLARVVGAVSAPNFQPSHA